MEQINISKTGEELIMGKGVFPWGVLSHVVPKINSMFILFCLIISKKTFENFNNYIISCSWENALNNVLQNKFLNP